MTKAQRKLDLYIVK